MLVLLLASGSVGAQEAGARSVTPPAARLMVRGKVLHAGIPLADVLVRLLEPGRAEPDVEHDFDLGDMPRTSSARSAADGEFAIAVDHPGLFELRAFALPHGAGRIGPLVIDGSHDLTGLALELDQPPGTLEGRVRFPPGHGPEEVWLDVSGYGYRSLRRDGSFRLPDLPPGPIPVRVLAGFGWDDPFGREPGEGWIHRTHGPTRAPAWVCGAMSFTGEVRAGKVERLDIDLALPAPCRIEGTLRIDGEPPRFRPNDRIPNIDRGRITLDPGDGCTPSASADADQDGRFTLPMQAPGVLRLRLEFGLAGTEHEKWLVLERAEIAPGLTPWNLDVATGALRILPARAESPLHGSGPLVRWEDLTGRLVFVQFPEKEPATGSFLYRRVPTGRVRLLTRGERQCMLECEVRAGEVSEVRWPGSAALSDGGAR